jgi:acid phosphatase (class A)
MNNIVRISITIFGSLVPMWSQPAAAPARVPGYLTSDQISAVTRIVPPAPATDDARYRADMAIFHETRSLEGTDRWTIAQSDDNFTMAGLLYAFRCALGLSLTPDQAPALTTLIGRANSDAGAAAGIVKQLYQQHKRPFQIAKGDVCLSPQGKAALERSPDYPSAHSTLSWETGLILGELVPEARGDLLARARAFGQSRIVCGVHNESAVEAGWMTATSVFAMQASSPEFKRDIDAARMELAALRAGAKQKPAGCEAESKTLSKSPY